MISQTQRIFRFFTYKCLIINNWLKIFGDLKLITQFTLAVFLQIHKKTEFKNYLHSSALYGVSDDLSFKRWKFFLNGEFLCFTLLSNFVKKIYLPNSQEKRQFRKNWFDTWKDLSILHFWLIRYVLWRIAT